jgi:nicotinamide mononucleotide transporter
MNKNNNKWKTLEIIWIISATIVILATSLYWKDNFLGIAAALTGIWCVILTGKGKISCFYFGTINTILYAVVAWNAKYWGEVMLNLLYYLPTNFIGIYFWKKNFNKETQEVKKEKLSLKSSIFIYLGLAISTLAYGFFLKLLKGTLPFVDSMSTVFSIFAQILCIKRLREQWILWIIVDVVTVYMWIYAFIQGTGDFATILMWAIYLINAILMFARWTKETK